MDDAKPNVRWLRCLVCHFGAVLNGVVFSPAVRAGEHLEGLPEDVASTYEEARACASVGGYTAAELVCRKILMHVAVDKGADPNKSFAYYLDHLENQGYVTPPMRPWVKAIKDNGNDAAHELGGTDRERGLMTLQFTAQLLRLVYEMSYKIAQYAQGQTP